MSRNSNLACRYIKQPKKFKYEKPDNALLTSKDAKSANAAWGSKSFYKLGRWRRTRKNAFKLYGKKCHCCGIHEEHMHVDHIKPRSHFPELAFDISNLQVLCRECNSKKGNHISTDFRPKQHRILAEKHTTINNKPNYLKKGKVKKLNKKSIERKIQKLNGRSMYEFENNLKNLVSSLYATNRKEDVDALLKQFNNIVEQKRQQVKQRGFSRATYNTKK